MVITITRWAMMVRNRAGTRLPTADILATIYLITQCANSVGLAKNVFLTAILISLAT